MATETGLQVESPPQPSEGGAESLRRKVLRGASWELVGQVGMQVWRFGSNIILTRLLVPEAFGVIGIVQVFMMSLTLLSDVGLQSSVIHDRRGEDRRFLDTVWTVSVLRGFVMWLVTCGLAYPFAQFFDMPGLLVLLPVTALSSIARGFASTRLMVANRNLRNDLLVRVEFGSQIAGTCITVLLAFWLRSAMALALGWVATSMLYTGFSYWGRDVERNRFCWDRDIVRSLSRFGRWALASGAFTIIQQRGDRLTLGKVVSEGALGNYVIGSNLAILPMTIFHRISWAIGQPIYARVKTLPPPAARSRIRRLRLGILATHLPVFIVLVAFGQDLVDLIYPPVFQLAGWYCRLAALAGLVRVATDLGPIFLAHGDSWSHFKIMAARTVALIFSIATGYFVGKGFGQAGDGVLYGVIFAPLLAYPYQSAMYRKINAWLPGIDILAMSPLPILMLGLIWQVI